MAVKQIWLNLPVKDVAKSKLFYQQIGFQENPMHQNSALLGSFFVGENKVVLMLFPESTFEKFANTKIADTQLGTEILLNIDAETRAEVDEMAVRVKNAGGTIFSEPTQAEGWMYAMGFLDLDGHRWCMLHMDFETMPK